MKNIDVLLVGVGGYGANYLNYMFSNGESLDATIKGIVDPFVVNSPKYQEILDKKIPVYNSVEDFYKEHKADLAFISTPIGLHYPQTKVCVENGSNVLVEKPMCATIEDAEKMAELDENYGKFVAVGYQLNYFEPMLELKKDILAGIYGKPKLFKTCVYARRGTKYYNRNNWAGKIKTDDGTPVYDSPLNNACAHNLHIIMFLLGDKFSSSAEVDEVYAETYRANKNIENFDTVALRVKTKSGVEALYYTTHAVSSSEALEPISEYHFENGVVYIGGLYGNMPVGKLNNGEIVNYGKLSQGVNDMHLKKIPDTIEATRNGKVLACRARTAIAQMLVVKATHEATDFDNLQVSDEFIDSFEIDGSFYQPIKGLESVLADCFVENKTPFELTNVPWAKEGKTIKL